MCYTPCLSCKIGVKLSPKYRINKTRRIIEAYFMYSGLREIKLILERIEGDYLIFKARVPKIPNLKEITEVYILGVIRNAIDPEAKIISNFKEELC